jgi:hypothetical protein
MIVDRLPILEVLTVVMMLAVAGVYLWQGLFRAAVTFFNTLAAGFLAFNLFEPVARGLEWGIGGGDYADAISLAGLFVLFLIGMRVLTMLAAPGDMAFPPWLKRLGGAAFGAATGYFAFAILICIFQILPCGQRFLGYDPERGIGLGAPDRVWLAMMHKATGQVFDRMNEDWFDADGSYIPRYARYRRVAEERAEPEKNQGEFPEVLSKKKRE